MVNQPQPSAQLKILHLIHGLTVGGAEVDLINKSAVLIRDYGYDITICCLMRRGELADRAETVGVKVIGPVMRQRYDVTAWRSLRRLLLSQPWDIVHTHLFAANLVGYLVMMTLPRSHRPPLLAAEHAMAERWGRVPLLLDRLIGRLALGVLVPSQAAADSYYRRGFPRERFWVVANGLDTAQFVQIDRAVSRRQVRQTLGVPDEMFLVGTVCRLEPVKGLPLLLEAIRDLPVYLIIVGDGPDRKRLAALVTSFHLDDRVQLLGRRSDVPQLLAAMDLFVLPSFSETFGIAVAEALLMKIPVVATSVGGIPEVTAGEQYARLVPPGDVAALAQAIGAVMTQPDLARLRAEQGAKFITDSLSVEVVSATQHRLYRQIQMGKK